MSTDKCVLNKRQIYSPLGLTSAATMPPRCTFVVRSLLIISSRDCREADSPDTSPRHACLGEVSRKIWLHDFAINNNGGSVPVIFISLDNPLYVYTVCYWWLKYGAVRYSTCVSINHGINFTHLLQ